MFGFHSVSRSVGIGKTLHRACTRNSFSSPNKTKSTVTEKSKNHAPAPSSKRQHQHQRQRQRQQHLRNKRMQEGANTSAYYDESISYSSPVMLWNLSSPPPVEALPMFGDIIRTHPY
mmetsp:Transcript_28061/g.46458  ORF Transcript_28061/g.46458 Transcript_28061/m.46458 type:complete len:117 (+) Transcript_28061:343-693(+)